MPVNYGYFNSEDEKIDILSKLQNSGVEFIVYSILHKLEIKDICAVFQVSRNWNLWDNDYFWSKELQSFNLHGDDTDQVLIGIESPKIAVQTLRRLRDSWKTSSNKKVSVMMESSVLCLTCKDTRVYCGLNSGELCQHDLKDGAEIRRKEMHEKGIKIVRFQPGFERMVTGSYDGCVKIWDNNWCLLKTIMVSVAVTDVAFDNRSSRGLIYITGDEGLTTCFSCDDGSQLWIVTGGEMMNCVTTWDNQLVTGSDSGNLDVRSPNSGQVVRSLIGHERGCGISGLAVNYLGLWSSSFDCKLRLWNTDGDCLCILVGHTNPVRCVTVDRFRVISGDYRGFVMIWDMEDIEREMWECDRKRKKKSSKSTAISGIYKMQGRQVIQTGSDACEVLQHSSLLEHHGNVTGVSQSGASILVSGSRDRSFNIHHFNFEKKTRNLERKSYL